MDQLQKLLELAAKRANTQVSAEQKQTTKSESAAGSTDSHPGKQLAQATSSTARSPVKQAVARVAERRNANEIRILFVGTSEDQPYLARLRPLIGTAQVMLYWEEVLTLTQILSAAHSRGITRVATTSPALLQKLVDASASSSVEGVRPKIDNYAGSLFTIKRTLRGEDVCVEFLILDPLEQLVSKTYGSFVTQRHLSKFTEPHKWRTHPIFIGFTTITPANLDAVLAYLESCDLVSIDSETRKEGLAITVVSYTGVRLVEGEAPELRSYILPIRETYDIFMMRQLNLVKPAKVLQNGKYDHAYFARFGAPCQNWLWDTAAAHHCWYSELPKDLGTLGAFYLRNAMYWKDLSQTRDTQEYYKYCALDSYATALVMLEWLYQAPEWARTNYMQEFPLLFPAHKCEMRGIRVDTEELVAAREEAEADILREQDKLNRMIGFKFHGRSLNVNSAPQMKALRTVLGCGDLASGDEKSLKKMALRHPINRRIVDCVLTIREKRKLVSTYLKPEKLYAPTERQRAAGAGTRDLFAINPYGTDTGRCASREHHFWCGRNIQNIPRGGVVKRIYVPDDGFLLAEVDLEQAESRDTGYISGDEALINAVSGTRDFHSVNASAFFGVPYESIYSDELGKSLDKALRDLAKRVNHGANYNMGAGVLVDTMGEEKIWEARRLLNLPRYWTAIQVAEFLLAQFHKTYPKIAGVYYEYVKSTVKTTHMLRSEAVHEAAYQATLAGWIRYCFGDPTKNKTALNAYVAHCPQSLNAMTLNKAFMQVFYDLDMSAEHSENFKLVAQIHDSILCQVRIGHEYLIEEVKKRMEIPVRIRSCDGVTRTFVVPAAPKAGKDGKGALRWSLTE